MAKSILSLCMVSIGMLLLASCSGGKAYVEVYQGNYAYQQGKFAEATLKYLSARDEKKYPEWISYNLGNVYHALGETDAALEVWAEYRDASDRDLLFRQSFNRGTLYYEIGKYREAYQEFRKALEINKSDMDTKINLELCLQKVRALGTSSGTLEKDRRSGARPEEQNETRRILEYVRRMEGKRWTSSESTDTPQNERDW